MPFLGGFDASPEGLALHGDDSQAHTNGRRCERYREKRLQNATENIFASIGYESQ